MHFHKTTEICNIILFYHAYCCRHDKMNIGNLWHFIILTGYQNNDTIRIHRWNLNIIIYIVEECTYEYDVCLRLHVVARESLHIHITKKQMAGILRYFLYYVNTLFYTIAKCNYLIFCDSWLMHFAKYKRLFETVQLRSITCRIKNVQFKVTYFSIYSYFQMFCIMLLKNYLVV